MEVYILRKMVLTKREIIPPPRETAQVLQELINNRKQIKAREYERNRRKLTAYEFIENAAKPLVNVMKGMFEDINSWDIRKLKDGRVGYARLAWENIEAILSQLNRMDRNEAVEILADVANKLPNPLTEQREIINKLGALYAQTPKGQNVSIEQLNKLGMIAEPGTASQGAMGAYRRRAGRFTGVFAPTGENPFPSQTGAEPTGESEQLPRGESSLPNLRRQYGDAVLGFTGEILKIGHPEDIRRAVEQGRNLAVEGLTDGEEDNLRQSEIGRVVLKSMEAFKDSQGENGEQARQNALKDLKLYFTAMNIAEDLKGRPYDIQKLIELSDTQDSTLGARAADSYTGLSEAQRHAQQYEAPDEPALGMDDDYFGQPEFRMSPPQSPRELPATGNVARTDEQMDTVIERSTGEKYYILDYLIGEGGDRAFVLRNTRTGAEKTRPVQEYVRTGLPSLLPTASAPMSGSVHTEQLLPLKDLSSEPSAPPIGGMPDELYGIMGRRPHYSNPDELNRRIAQEADEIWDRALRMGEEEHVTGFRKGIDTTNIVKDMQDTGETRESQIEQIKQNISEGVYPLKDTLIDIYAFKWKSAKEIAQDIVTLVEGMAQMDEPPAYDIIKDVAEGKRRPQALKDTPLNPPKNARWDNSSSDASGSGLIETLTDDLNRIKGLQHIRDNWGRDMDEHPDADIQANILKRIEDAKQQLSEYSFPSIGSHRESSMDVPLEPKAESLWREIAKLLGRKLGSGIHSTLSNAVDSYNNSSATNNTFKNIKDYAYYAITTGDEIPEDIRSAASQYIARLTPTDLAMGRFEASLDKPHMPDGRGFAPNKKWNPLKLSANGDLGDINVSLPRLLEHMELIVKKKKGGKVMMRKKGVPLDLIRLLTRRYNPKSTYSDDAKGIYRKIINLAKVPLGQSHSQKEHIMGTGFKVPVTPMPNEETEIIEEHKPDDVLEKLMVALGTWKNGNRNNIVKNKISSYADFLLKHNLIDKKEHKLLHDLIERGNKAMTPELNEFLNEIFS